MRAGGLALLRNLQNALSSSSAAKMKPKRGYHQGVANKPVSILKNVSDAIGKKKSAPQGGNASRHISTSKPKSGNKMNMILYKKHGQHLLKNPGILDKILLAAKIKSSDVVLEIGCGTGNLTVKLLPIAKKVITIDIDARMVSEVKKRCLYEGYNNLEVYEGDAIKTVFPRFDICTANIPYKISSPLIFKLIAHRPLFKCAVLMFQKEFADRMLANVGDSNYSRLTVNVKLFCKVVKICNVDRSSFNPPPKVDSVILKLIPKENNFFINFDEWDNLLRICFSRKRKTLHAIFKRNAVLNMLEHNYKNFCTFNKIVPVNFPFKKYCLDTLKELDMTECRSVSLDENDFLKLLLKFNKKGIHFFNISNVGSSRAANIVLNEEGDVRGDGGVGGAGGAGSDSSDDSDNSDSDGYDDVDSIHEKV
ncbi:dimethyladenosine transferase [Plasmodium vivax India VII]|uniref:rRNA adenine N(6)-methyltransferase n=3 Tax=Plasmodium vivax TaxID=5855 RepID=A0A1G4H3N3_PLAVI|nr:dimethyladenosine transferase [Plasmodium vivax India VII]KMZ83863.1 dimethyladenosine transferase [Plasmodium vivax Brazil I]SCO69431.1 dimethyladenosine transferase, putative [Plasmodium vivax]